MSKAGKLLRKSLMYLTERNTAALASPAPCAYSRVLNVSFPTAKWIVPSFAYSLPSLLSLTICVTKPGEDKKPPVQGAAVNSALRLISSFRPLCLIILSYFAHFAHFALSLQPSFRRLSVSMLLFPGQQPRFTAYRAQNILHRTSCTEDRLETTWKQAQGITEWRLNQRENN